MTIANASAPGLLGALLAEITRIKFGSGIRGKTTSLRRIASYRPECEKGRKQSEEYKHHPIEGPHPVTPVVRRDGHEQKNSDWDRNPNHPSDRCRD